MACSELCSWKQCWDPVMDPWLPGPFPCHCLVASSLQSDMFSWWYGNEVKWTDKLCSMENEKTEYKNEVSVKPWK